MVTVLVGPSEKTYTLHEKALSSGSAFFAKALKDGRFKEGAEMCIKLPEETPEIFESLVQWLYNGFVQHDITIPGKISLYAFPQIYAIANRLLIPGLKDAAVDALKKRATSEEGCILDSEVVATIYKYAPASSAFRRIVVEAIVSEVLVPNGLSEDDHYVDGLLTSHEDVPLEVVRGLMAARRPHMNHWKQMSRKFAKLPFDFGRGRPCDYHDHADGERCYLKKPATQG